MAMVVMVVPMFILTGAVGSRLAATLRAVVSPVVVMVMVVVVPMRSLRITGDALLFGVRHRRWNAAAASLCTDQLFLQQGTSRTCDCGAETITSTPLQPAGVGCATAEEVQRDELCDPPK